MKPHESEGWLTNAGSAHFPGELARECTCIRCILPRLQAGNPGKIIRIGKPQGTAYASASELEAEGMQGVYRFNEVDAYERWFKDTPYDEDGGMNKEAVSCLARLEGVNQ